VDREAYQCIGKVCVRGRDVVKALIHFAQPTLANQAPLELNDLIREVGALLESTARNRIRIAEVLAGEPLWSNGNAGDLGHILMNLGLNALDAMPDGGTLTFRSSVPEAGWAQVSVEDDGTGIAPEVLPHVMEPFFTTKEVGQGTGLGLSMAYGVIKAHGGSIDIASRPGQGTVVKLRLPRIAAPVQAEPSAPPARALSLGSLKVFLVDDDEDVRFLMTRMLKKAGVRQVEVFAGGEDVLAVLGAEELPDLIILDQNMPGMNGTETMERIRGLHPDLPILISSGQPDLEEWDCFRQPRVGVISKPFTKDEIQARLAQFSGEAVPG
jgi:CheY-like chemotaxis protein